MEQIAFPRYEQYKPSGINWVGNIPNHWETHKGKWLFKKMDRPVRPEDEIVTAFRDGTVTLRSNRRTEGFTNAVQEHGYQGIRKGDLVIHAMDAFAGAIGVSDSDGKATPVYAACVSRNEFDIGSQYYAYLLRFMSKAGYIEALAKGIRERSTDFRFNDFGQLLLPVPPKPEQDRIANFLDQKTAEIDEAIAKKQCLIELLKEQKAILINQAVTKGLNPKAPMRDSGVEWIGEIPSSWRVLPLTKYLKSIIDYRGKTPTKSDSGTFLVTAKNIKNGFIDYEVSKEYVAGSDYQKIMARGQPKINDILFTTEAPLGSVALVDREDIALAQRVIKFRVNELELEPEFAKISLSASYFQNYLLMLATGSTALGIKSSKLHQLKIIVPPIKDQKEIVKFSNDKINQFDLVIFLNQRGIEYLQELKCILISNAVTGKIKL